MSSSRRPQLRNLRIGVSSGSTVTNCIATENFNGIGGGSIIIGCSAFRNRGTGISSPGGIIINCSAEGNELNGFSVSDGGTVADSTAKDNKGNGIQADTHCFIRNNLSDRNTGFGIHTTGVRNRIDGNQVSRNDVGFKVEGVNSLIIRNTATGNTPNWQIAKDNDVGVIADPPSSPAIDGNTGGSGVTTTDPWANFSY